MSDDGALQAIADAIRASRLLVGARAGRNEHGWYWLTSALREADAAAERACTTIDAVLASSSPSVRTLLDPDFEP